MTLRTVAPTETQIYPDKPLFDDVTECAKGINERISALHIKGPKRQADEAIAYACGLAKALSLAYPNITLPIMPWLAFDLAFHGMDAVKKVLTTDQE